MRNMKVRLALIIGMWCFCANAQTTSNPNYNLLIGTYTSKGNSEGIYVYNFNIQTGESSLKSKVGGVKNPSYLAISKDRKHVYSVSEQGKGSGTINAFSFNPVSGELVFMNSATSGGDGPCYVTVDDNQKYVFSANYSGGSLAAIPLKADGSLGTDVQVIQHTGSSIVKDNQDKPHVHSNVLSPDNRYLFTSDLGTDKIYVYDYIAGRKQPLKEASPAFVKMKAGTGPRHFTFHPNGKFAYVIQELGCEITAFSYKNGRLTTLQSVSILPKDYKGPMEAADIHISPDGKFLYGSNREDANEIVIFKIGTDGKLTYAGRQSTLGKAPRNFAIDPSGSFLLVANQNTNEVIVFNRDKNTGLLTDSGKKIAVGMPVCLKFVSNNP